MTCIPGSEFILKNLSMGGERTTIVSSSILKIRLEKRKCRLPASSSFHAVFYILTKTNYNRHI